MFGGKKNIFFLEEVSLQHIVSHYFIRLQEHSLFQASGRIFVKSSKLRTYFLNLKKYTSFNFFQEIFS